MHARGGQTLGDVSLPGTEIQHNCPAAIAPARRYQRVIVDGVGEFSAQFVVVSLDVFNADRSHQFNAVASNDER